MIVFKSKSVEASGDNYKVTGELMLHGVTKPLALEIKTRREWKVRFAAEAKRILHSSAATSA
jgi:polyisoprenoid-binding protein YceI